MRSDKRSILRIAITRGRNLQRLDAEIIRDRMLATVDRLDRHLFGAPVAIKEDDAGQVIVDGSQTRRSLYIRQRRTQPVAMLQTFDAPVMDINCEYRPVSTVATQSLMLLNGEFTVEQAGHLADRILRELEGKEKSCNSQIERAWQLVFARSPREPELNAATTFMSAQLEELNRDKSGVAANSTPERQVLVNLCQMLFNSNEFLYVD